MRRFGHAAGAALGMLTPLALVMPAPAAGYGGSVDAFATGADRHGESRSSSPVMTCGC